MLLCLEGFVLGLSTAGYCLGACMPFLVPYLLAEARPSAWANLKYILEFLFGRLLAYIIFASVMSVLGKNFQGLVFAKVLAIAMIISAFLMLAFAGVKNFPQLHFCAKISKNRFFIRIPFFLGFLVGINICPPFMVGMIRLLELARVVKGLVYFLGFFLGTALYTLPLLSVTWLAKIKRLQNIGVLAAFITGGWFLIIGVFSLIK
ncbi:MAG: sulfite exporter TauE/SafE family protein [Candidatus Omnitrophica bacterium]|nr:sulfite exporter TauE/SafE family protein [Candidatus Omnitrophota bacterium]